MFSNSYAPDQRLKTTCSPKAVKGSDSLNVCHIVSTFPRALDDPEVPWLLQCIRRLKEKGLEVKVFAPAFKGLRDQEISGISVHRFRYFFRRWENLTHDEGAPNKLRKNPLYIFVAIFYILFGVIDIIRYCHRERFDILHVHWPFPHGIFGYVGGRLSRSKLILNFHGAELSLIGELGFVKIVLAWLIKRADRVIANSSFTANKVRVVYKRAVEVIPYGSPFEQKDVGRPVSSGRSESEETRNVLFVGRLIERKGVEYLVKAIKLVNQSVKARLIVVGEGHQRRGIEELVKKEGLSDAVKLVGKVDSKQLDRYYRGCDVFVLPAIVDSKGDTEGLGVVLLEALSYKKPVVATDVGGIADIIVNDETGILVPEKDPLALANAIVRVLEDGQLARRLGSKGYEYIRARFSWSKVTDGIIDVYRGTVEHEDPAFNIR